MKKKGVMTGLGVGAAVGAVAAVATSMMSDSSTKKSMMKKANKAVKHMSGMISDVQYMFK